MIRTLLLISLMVCIAASCDNDFEEANSTSDQTNVTRMQSKASDDELVDDELVVVYGSDRTVSVKKAKLVLNSASAAKFGLQQGTYIVEYLLCYKNVYKPGYDIWDEDSKKCGYKPSQNFVLGNSSIAMTKERGYEVPESNTKELKTFVLHVISDFSGRNEDKYDPCAPKDIEWIYSITPQ